MSKIDLDDKTQIEASARADRATVYTGPAKEYDPSCFEVAYRADEDHGHKAWRPSLYLPRVLSRITLEVESVRVQRLQDISEEDARAEGVIPYTTNTLRMADPEAKGPLYRPAFQDLWDSINGDRAPWSSNPWVWAISFRRLP